MQMVPMMMPNGSVRPSPSVMLLRVIAPAVGWQISKAHARSGHLHQHVPEALLPVTGYVRPGGLRAAAAARHGSGVRSSAATRQRQLPLSAILMLSELCGWHIVFCGVEGTDGGETHACKGCHDLTTPLAPGMRLGT